MISHPVFIFQYLGKVKLALYVINSAPFHEDAGGSGGIVPPFLTSALNVCEWSAWGLCVCLHVSSQKVFIEFYSSDHMSLY
jgi:hypothetical protein